MSDDFGFCAASVVIFPVFNWSGPFLFSLEIRFKKVGIIFEDQTITCSQRHCCWMEKTSEAQSSTKSVELWVVRREERWGWRWEALTAGTGRNTMVRRHRVQLSSWEAYWGLNSSISSSSKHLYLCPSPPFPSSSPSFILLHPCASHHLRFSFFFILKLYRPLAFFSSFFSSAILSPHPSTFFPPSSSFNLLPSSSFFFLLILPIIM